MKANELEAAYLEAALCWSRSQADNLPAANQAFEELQNLKNQMRALLPDKGEAILKRFAEHPDVELRINACSHLLAIDESFALTKLAEIEKTRVGFASLTAEYTIKEWRAGKLTGYLK